MRRDYAPTAEGGSTAFGTVAWYWTRHIIDRDYTPRPSVSPFCAKPMLSLSLSLSPWICISCLSSYVTFP